MSIFRRMFGRSAEEVTLVTNEGDIFNDPEAWQPMSLGMPGVGSTPPRVRTAAGVRVTPENAIGLSAYYACARNIAEDVAKLPLCVYETKAGVRGKEKATAHPSYRLLRSSANDVLSAYAFRELLTFYAVTWGNGYAEIQRLNDGTPVALYPVHPSRVRPQLVELEDGSLEIVYLVRGSDPTEEPVPLSSDRMLHVRGLGTNGVEGLSMARIGAESIGVGLAAQDYAGAMFGNDLTLGTLLKSPAALSDKAFNRLKETMGSEYVGARKAFKFRILEEGLDVARAGIPPKDAQFLEARGFQVIEICRWFRMPPHKIASLDKATLTNIEHQGIEYVTDCLMPWLVRWEQEVDRKLVETVTPASAARSYEARHVVQALMRGDYTTRTQGYDRAIKAGWMTPNEARELEDMNPAKDENADRLVIQGAMVLLDSLGSEPAPNDPPTMPYGDGGEDEPPKKAPPAAEPPEDPEASARAFALPVASPLIEASARRLARKWTRTTEDGCRKHAGAVAFARWVGEQDKVTQEDVRTAFAPVVESVRAASAFLARKGTVAVLGDLDDRLDVLGRECATWFARAAGNAHGSGPAGILSWSSPEAEAQRVDKIRAMVAATLFPEKK